jgi:hypothetical protein
LEEVKRSWSKPPNALDMMYHSNLIKQFNDPDNDDKAFKEFSTKRREARRQLLQSHKEMKNAKAV